MAHFYSEIRGSAQTTATRCGTKHSGLTANIAGWKGCIRVDITHNAATGQDHYAVELTPWQGSGGKTVTLAKGILDARGSDDA